VLAGPDGAGVMHLSKLSEGHGLNPLLQYPEMVIHPPMLYLGYTGFTVPFAFALAALLGRYPGEKWIHITRRWTMIAWCFQSIGILLGAHWAYAVLGWGGYWAWDPVENASLLPWITGTAFLHSVMMQEKRGMMKVWNVWLVFTTFMLCILGTMLTRSGVVSSVHAFAQSSIGSWFVGFLIITFLVCLPAAYWKNRDYLRSDNQLDSLVSRESSFLFNNLILLAACFAVSVGHALPGAFGMGAGKQDQRRRALLQQGERPDRAVPAAAHRRRPAARLAQDIFRCPEAQFRMALRRRRACRNHRIHFRFPRYLRAFA
jgi:c-type cytochrome biogenesis protein CcmF